MMLSGDEFEPAPIPGSYTDSQGRTITPGSEWFGPTAPSGSYVNQFGRTVVPAAAPRAPRVSPGEPEPMSATTPRPNKTWLYVGLGALALLLMPKRR